MTVIDGEQTTKETLLDLASKIFSAYDEMIGDLSDPLTDQIDADGWNTRQLLSHIIGSWSRVPLMGGFFL